MKHNDFPVDFNRLNGLADAIFAVAMTFLAFSVHVPPHLTAATPMVLTQQFFNVIIGFFVTGRYWINHNRLHKLIIHGNETLVMLDLLLLFGIVMIPVSLRLYDDLPFGFVGITLYSSTFIFVGLMNAVVYVYALRHPQFLRDENTKDKVHLALKLLILPMVIYLSPIMIAVWQPIYAPTAWWLMFAVPAINRRLFPASRFLSQKVMS